MTKMCKSWYLYHSPLMSASNRPIDFVNKAKLRHSSLRDHHSLLVDVALAFGFDSHRASLQARLRVALFGRLHLCPIIDRSLAMCFERNGGLATYSCRSCTHFITHAMAMKTHRVEGSERIAFGESRRFHSLVDEQRDSKLLSTARWSSWRSA